MEAIPKELTNLMKRLEQKQEKIEEGYMTKFIKLIPSLNKLEELVMYLGSGKHNTGSSIW